MTLEARRGGNINPELRPVPRDRDNARRPPVSDLCDRMANDLAFAGAPRACWIGQPCGGHRSGDNSLSVDRNGHMRRKATSGARPYRL